jgi:valyl-tRNA synthetase
MNNKFLNPYQPQETESRIYKIWEESGHFNPDKTIEAGLIPKDAETFSIVMPPPNVTGILHMGHALMLTVEDIVVRYQRMLGKKTLWIPGTDHAAIATQARVEKDIQKAEGKSRHDLGREELLKRIVKFAEESHDTITSQVRVMGASCDWSREAFTLDEKRERAVRTAFKNMYEDGLIYRGHRIVNWDPKGQTTISDDEIVYEERQAKLYTFKYSKDFPIAISTTRPETKVGDTAVAVHPDDKRYSEYVGKEFDVVFCDVPLHIKVIADKDVDPEFGTGALGVTPAHSHIDWEMSERHELPRPQVINEYAKMTVEGRLADKKVTEAREMVVEWLRSEDLLEKEEDIKQNISTAERTGGIVEPLPKLQWFINVNKPIEKRGGKTLKELMRAPLETGEISIIPNYFDKTYFHWIDNLRDWCISRQIWYGHRIPVWYRSTDAHEAETHVGISAPEGEGWQQDEDTLDTWFSSALWTFSTLGWPEETQDLRDYHPTALMETGYEILFFWVARMILMSEYHLGEIPFSTIYLHGTVRDDKGRKMSKSLGNGIDPLDVAKEFGADAGRMALIVGTAPGTDSKVSKDKIKGYKNFANKVWNITRFVLSNLTEDFEPKTPLVDEDIKELEEEIKELTRELNDYRIHNAAERVYHYIWHTFADKILEESKKILFDESASEETRDAVRQKLVYILTCALKMLHPFMPFVTEEIWQDLPWQKETDLLMVSRWPLLR